MLTVRRTNQQEITGVNGGYPPDIQPFGDGHDADINEVQPGISIGDDQLSRTMVGQYLEILARVIVQGQQEGVFRAGLDPVFASKAVFGILDEMATDWVLSHRNTRLESKAADVAEFVLGGLAASS